MMIRSRYDQPSLLARLWLRIGAFLGKTLLWLLLSALATGASWLCYFRALQRGPARQTSSAWCWWRCLPSPSCTSGWLGVNGWAWR